MGGAKKSRCAGSQLALLTVSYSYIFVYVSFTFLLFCVAKGIDEPEIVVAVTAHAAFDKAANYFGMKLVHVDVDPVTRLYIKS